MEQYSPKNQQFILSQMPTASDVRPFKAWKIAGRSIVKGSKSLRVYLPGGRTAPVFDISQTKPCAPRHQAAANTERQIAAEQDAFDRAYVDYDAAINAGDIPADLDFDIWYELREETRIAIARGELPAAPTPTIPASTPDYTIATTGHDGAPVIIAQVEHHDLYAPIAGGSQELDTIDQETANAVSTHPIGCPCQDCTAGHETHAAEIQLHNAAGHLVQQFVFVTLDAATDAFFALENGTATDLPADWFTATLYAFENGLRLTERATYRTTRGVTEQYRAELLEIGTRSYAWSSHSPEKNAAYDYDCFARMIDEQSAQWHALATTPDMHALVDQLATDYAAGYMAQYRTVAAARGRVASTFVTGGSNFNHRRNDKAQAAYAKRSQDMDAWLTAFRTKARKQLAAIEPAEDAAYRQLKAHVTRQLVMCGQIDAGQWPGFRRQSFATSAASKIRTAHKNGHTQAVADVLAWLRTEQASLLASGHITTPMLTDRHAIWTLA